MTNLEKLFELLEFHSEKLARIENLLIENILEKEVKHDTNAT